MNVLLRMTVLTACVVGCLAPGVRAQPVTPIGPFSGQFHENYDNLGLNFGDAVSQLSLFGGSAVIRNLTSGGSIKYAGNSTLGGDTVVARSAPGMIGQLGIAQWDFTQPVDRFGSYFENNSRFDDAVIDFYDTSLTKIATLNVTDPHALQAWTWNGWQSTVPISRVVVTGNDSGFLNGFIWYDDSEIRLAPSSVPEPTTFLLVGCGICGVAGIAWRRRRAGRTAAQVDSHSEL